MTNGSGDCENPSPQDRFVVGYGWGVYHALAWAAKRSLSLRSHCELVRAALIARELRIAGTPTLRRMLDAIAAQLAAPDGPTTTHSAKTASRRTQSPRRS